jgi:hypothetical protein
MFNSPRYATKEIMDMVSIELQAFLWSLIDTRRERGDDLDYLQVFTLSKKINDRHQELQVSYHQEEPFYCEIFTINIPEEAIDKITIWVINSGDYSTMLLPHEY